MDSAIERGLTIIIFENSWSILVISFLSNKDFREVSLPYAGIANQGTFQVRQWHLHSVIGMLWLISVFSSVFILINVTRRRFFLYNTAYCWTMGCTFMFWYLTTETTCKPRKEYWKKSKTQHVVVTMLAFSLR